MKKFLILAAMGLAFAACGDDTSKGGGGGGGGGNNTENNATPDRTSVDLNFGGEAIERDIPNDQASNESAAAVIGPSTLTLTIVSEMGVAISAVVETSAQNTAPGTFAVGAPPENSYVSVSDPLAGSAWESASGNIVLTSCPKAVGEKINGRFEGVQLAPLNGGDAKELSGSFSVVVLTKSGDLDCAAEPEPSNNSNNPVNNPNNPNQCQVSICEDEGICCPYIECMSQCELECFSDCAAGNIQACAACNDSCYDSCGVSDACASAIQVVNACEETNQCDPFGDEDAYDACLQENCCSEIDAAF